jgi:hypothetical protein
MEIYRVEIPQHVRKIQLSAKQRPKYFDWDGFSIKGKVKVPVRFHQKSIARTKETTIEQLKDNYYIVFFADNKPTFATRETTYLPNVVQLMQTKVKYRLCIKSDNEYIPILSNTKTVNTPKMYLIKGQDIYSGNLREHMRGTVMDAIKECYKPYLVSLPVIDKYPIRIDCEIHDTIKNIYDRSIKEENLGQKWDIDNYAFPYVKAFPDLMQKLGKLRNDDRLHVTQLSSSFVPIDNHKNRKLVFIISTDERDIIKNNETYQKYHRDSYESEDTLLVKDEEPFGDLSVYVKETNEQKEKINEILNWKQSAALEVGLNKNKENEKI